MRGGAQSIGCLAFAVVVERKRWLDGLSPRDFEAPEQPPQMIRGRWPLGPFALPAKFQTLPPDEQVFLLETVRELAAEVRTHVEWRQRSGMTQERVAKRVQMPVSRLSAFENGSRWPAWDLLMALRVLRRQFADDRIAEQTPPESTATQPPGPLRRR